MSIKQAAYHLPVILPETYIKTLGTGANQPIVITGCDELTHLSDEFVVKISAAERMSPDACFRETLACFMAMEMDIPVVEPVVVNITPDFADAQLGKDCYQRLQQSLGINFGSRLVRNFQLTPNDQPFNNQQLEYAKDVFMFDMFIQNPDRTKLKPNMFTNGKEIMIFDHELAFSFLLLIGGDTQPWLVTRQKWGNWLDMILPPKIKTVKFDEEVIFGKLSKFDEEFWNKAHALIPADWMNNAYFQRIQNHVNLVKANQTEFVKSLQKIII